MRARKLLCVVGYDISCDKLRKKVDKLLSRYGSRVNRSLFECMMTRSQYHAVVDQLQTMIKSPSDSVIVYRICVDCYASRELIPEKKTKYSNVVVV